MIKTTIRFQDETWQELKTYAANNHLTITDAVDELTRFAIATQANPAYTSLLDKQIAATLNTLADSIQSGILHSLIEMNNSTQEALKTSLGLNYAQLVKLCESEEEMNQLILTGTELSNTNKKDSSGYS